MSDTDSDMTKHVVDYLNRRAAEAERIAIEAYKIIDTLMDQGKVECELREGSKDAGLYCLNHGYFQNDMIDGKCPQRRAIEWMEENEKLGQAAEASME